MLGDVYKPSISSIDKNTLGDVYKPSAAQIDGLVQEGGNSIANALDYIFRALTHPDKNTLGGVYKPSAAQIDGLEQEGGNSIANALDYIFRALTHPDKNTLGDVYKPSPAKTRTRWETCTQTFSHQHKWLSSLSCKMSNTVWHCYNMVH